MCERYFLLNFFINLSRASKIAGLTLTYHIKYSKIMNWETYECFPTCDLMYENLYRCITNNSGSLIALFTEPSHTKQHCVTVY